MNKPRTIALTTCTCAFLLCNQAGLCESAKAAATDPVFQVEQPHTDASNGKPVPIKKKLQGSLQIEAEDPEAYAKSPSAKPFLQGVVREGLPAAWRGKWEGTVQLDELRGGATNNNLRGSNVDMALEMEAAKGGSNVFNLSVHELAGRIVDEADKTALAGGSQTPDPDIHFWRDGDTSYLHLKNGTSTYINGNFIVGGPPGSKAVVIIGGSGPDKEPGSPSPQNAAAGSANDSVNYDKSAIVTTGSTEFNGKYFKSDDGISLKSTRINTDRIDIGSRTVYTGGVPVHAAGNQQTGYLLSQLSGASTFVSPGQTNVAQQPIQSVQLIGGSKKPTIQIVRIAPGIFDVKSVSTLTSANGTAYGSQQVVARFTALSSNRMIIQMTTENYDTNSHLRNSFNASGNLNR